MFTGSHWSTYFLGGFFWPGSFLSSALKVPCLKPTSTLRIETIGNFDCKLIAPVACLLASCLPGLTRMVPASNGYRPGAGTRYLDSKHCSVSKVPMYRRSNSTLLRESDSWLASPREGHRVAPTHSHLPGLITSGLPHRANNTSQSAKRAPGRWTLLP